MILLIDNYDSFVHNLARYFQRLGQETRVTRNDALTLDEIRRLKPRAIVISPGPRTPSEAGCSVELVQKLHQEIPILGVCLGHQAIAAAFGARVLPAPEPVHGRTSEITHYGAGVFEGLPSPLTVCRYHSLIVDEASLSSELGVTARSEDGSIMALEHSQYPTVGVQFHPESTLTEHGYKLLANFLHLAGLRADGPAENLAATEFAFAISHERPVPAGPVTF